MSQTYPISLVLTGKAVLVVGGGEVATRKVKGLLECGARVTIVSPDLTPELKQLAQQGSCIWCEKTYETVDLDDVSLVFACTSDEAVNKRISQDAAQQKLLINVADCPELCSFYLPSVLQKGRLSIAVSTDGSSPITARRIRERLEEKIDEEIAVYLDLLQSWRERVMSSPLSAEKRQIFWERVSEGQVYELVKSGNNAEAEILLSKTFEELEI